VFANQVQINTADMPEWFKTTTASHIRHQIAGQDAALTQPTTTAEVRNIIKAMRTNACPGPDKIPAEILKMLSQDMLEVITTFINVTLATATIPDAWRHTNIWTIHKGGDSFRCENYRPIALSDTLYKVYALLLTQRLVALLENKRVLSFAQAGARKNKSTFHKLITLTAIIEDAKRRQSELHVGYVDLRKAYDSVEHNGILQTLTQIGFNEHFIRAIRDIYTGNTTRVITPYGATEEVRVMRGVRQGCPMSPILFILFMEPLLNYINDHVEGYRIPGSQVPISVLAYMDDIAFETQTHEAMQACFRIMSVFCHYYGLKMNTDGRAKTVYTTTATAPAEIVITEWSADRGFMDTPVPGIK